MRRANPGQDAQAIGSRYRQKTIRVGIVPRAPELLGFGMLYALFMGAILSGLVTFTSWPQVDLLHNARVDLDLLYSHPHFFRYLIARPGLMLADQVGDIGFSVYVAHFAFGSLSLMYYLVRDKPVALRFLCVFTIFGVQLLMNGRGTISWFGWMVVLVYLFEVRSPKPLSHLPVLLVALLCTSVSSGTFSVAFVTLLVYLTSRAVSSDTSKNLITVAVIAVLYTGLFLEGLERNIDFYALGTRNPLLNMLRHGVGDIVLNHPVLILGALCFLMLGGLIAWYQLRRKPEIRELLVLAVPLAGGAFGITTLTLFLPSLLTVVPRRLFDLDRVQSAPLQRFSTIAQRPI